MAQYASFCLIKSPFKGEVPVFARLWHVRVRIRISFPTGAVRSAILAIAGLLVTLCFHSVKNGSYCMLMSTDRVFPVSPINTYIPLSCIFLPSKDVGGCKM